jgi:hypothetical protein
MSQPNSATFRRADYAYKTRTLEARLRKLHLIVSDLTAARSSGREARKIDKFFAKPAGRRISSRKILLRRPVSSITSSGVFQECSGGEQPPFTSIGRGGRYFFRGKLGAMKKSSAAQARFSWPATLTVVVLIAAVVIVVIFLRLESWPARTAAQGTTELERLGKDLRAAFIDVAHLQPRITINNRVYLEQSIPTSELVILARRIEVEHELLHTWAGSSKRVKLHGTFTVKAGFDLRQDLAVDIRADEIAVQLPHAQLLGVEQDQLEVLAFENGFWNRISANDVQNELSILPQLARQKAAESNLPSEAENALQKQLHERIHTRRPLKLVFTSSVKND